HGHDLGGRVVEQIPLGTPLAGFSFLVTALTTAGAHPAHPHGHPALGTAATGRRSPTSRRSLLFAGRRWYLGAGHLPLPSLLRLPPTPPPRPQTPRGTHRRRPTPHQTRLSRRRNWRSPKNHRHHRPTRSSGSARRRGGPRRG